MLSTVQFAFNYFSVSSCLDNSCSRKSFTTYEIEMSVNFMSCNVCFTMVFIVQMSHIMALINRSVNTFVTTQNYLDAYQPNLIKTKTDAHTHRPEPSHWITRWQKNDKSSFNYETLFLFLFFISVFLVFTSTSILIATLTSITLCMHRVIYFDYTLFSEW